MIEREPGFFDPQSAQRFDNEIKFAEVPPFFLSNGISFLSVLHFFIVIVHYQAKTSIRN